MIETFVAAGLAGLAALVPWALGRRPPWPVWIALAAVFYPAADALVEFAEVAELVGQPTTLQALTPAQLARIPYNIVENNLLVPAAGLALAFVLGAREAVGSWISPMTRRARAWVPEVSIGWAAVPIVVGAEAVALAALEGPASFLQTADESALFANATLANVALLCLVPALVEEIYYRQLLQGGLEALWPGEKAAWAAIGLQAVIFGLAHGGYTSLAHILGPLVFGLGMGVLRSIGGLGACIVAHAGVNLFYFAIDPGAGSTLLLAVTGAVTLVGLGLLAVLWSTIRARLRAGVRPVLESGRLTCSSRGAR